MSIDFQPYLAAIEEQLHTIIIAPSNDLAPFYNMMAYHLGWLDAQFHPVAAYSGKRIRPLLCLLSCEAAGEDWHKALPAAAALELVHNFSLIHDDIEDNSPTRRGRPTLWHLWGLPQGINAGDGMLVLACQAINRSSDHKVNTATTLATINILQQTILALCHGQYLDIAFEGHLDLSQESYLQMIGGKTASLFAASTQLGALIGKAGEKTEHYRQFGWNLGLAFQMVDDILGIWGNPAITGKPVADDIRSRKMTLPVIFALRQSVERDKLTTLYRQESLSDEDIAHAVRILERAGAQQYVQGLAAQYEASALAALDAAEPREPAAGRLRSLAMSLTARRR